jgi:Tfp pilus assembly protein PilF
MSRIVRTLGMLFLAASLGVIFTAAADAQVSRKTEIHRMLADIYDRQGNTHAAMLEYNQLVVAAPNDAEAHSSFGRYLFRQKETAFAAREFKRATQLDPSRTDNWKNLGNALLANRDYKGAIEALRRGGPECAPQLQQALQYQQQVQQVDNYNKQLKQQQQAQ